MTRVHAPEIEMLYVLIADLFVDSGDGGYQRLLDAPRAKGYAEKFSPGAMKAINVSIRPDGTMAVTDGQHTVRMVSALGYTHIQAMVTYGNRKLEAENFLLNNAPEGRKQVSTSQRHRAALVAGNGIAVQVQSLLTTYGVEISTGGLRKGRTNAIGAITQYAKSNPVALKLVMDSIAELWSDDDCAWSAIVIRGMYDLAISVHDLPTIISRLRRRNATARQVMDIASVLQTAAGAKGGGAAYAKTAILKASGIKLR